jgi:hypothetical protein
MNVAQTKEGIKMCMDAHLPIMLWGPGGVGKSEAVEQIAKELEIGYICFEAPIRDPIDICGYPAEEGKYMIWRRPSILPESGSGIFHIDELPDCAPLLMKALYHLILKNEVAGHKVPESWYIIGSGNRPEDKGMGNPLPAPLITRLVHVGVYCDPPDFTNETPEKADVDFDSFITYTLKNKFHELVVAFLKFKSELVYRHQATPRTWEYVSKLLTAITPAKHSDFVFKQLIAGTIGQGPAVDFNSFVEMARKVPNIDALIKNPLKAAIPDKKSILYAVTTGLLFRLNDKTESNIIQYIQRLPSEYQFYFFKSAIHIRQEMIANKLYIEWVNNNKEYILD